MPDLYRLRREAPEEYIRLASKLLDEHLGYILIFDRDDRIVFMSDEVCRDLACSREEMLGLHKSALIQRGYTERSASEFVKRTGRQALVSVKALKTNEVMFANSCPIYDEAGDLAFIVNRSETERDLIQKMNVIYQERSLLENQYQQLGSQQGRQHTIVARSPASMALFGVARRLLSGTPPSCSLGSLAWARRYWLASSTRTALAEASPLCLSTARPSPAS